MVNITSKTSTLRQAIATAVVKMSKKETVEAVKANAVPKGNVLECARTAGLFAVKRTSDMIPDCHPIPVEYAQVRYEVKDLEIVIEVEVHTIYKTGVEVEAMHGASVVALTIYDMLKPIDNGIVISSIQLKEKKGGKSDGLNKFRKDLKAAVIVCSDSISSGKGEDAAGKAIIRKLETFDVNIAAYVVIPDEPKAIQQEIIRLLSAGNDIIIFTGGTGLSARDITPEVIRPMLEREIPGIMEVARMYGQERTPFSMLSRGIAGMIGKSLILTLPGSEKAAKESMDAIFPAALHIFNVIEGVKHD